MLTRKKDLRTGQPVWALTRKPRVPHGPLHGSLVTDVLVVGAGITGAVVAEGLTEAGLRVVIVDRRSPVAGSTSASTALLQYEIDTPLTKLSRSLGVDAAETIWRRSRLALGALSERTARLGIDADMRRRNALYLAGDVLDAKGLAREGQARRRAGFEVELLHAKALRERYGIRRQAGLLGFGDLVADPRKLAAGFLRVAVNRGAQVFAPVDVVDVDESALRVVATTNAGHAIRARQVIFATGYEVAKGVPAKGHSIQSTWVIATRPQRSKLWPTECMIWEASEPYVYMRTTTDGRVICGREDEPFEDDARRDASSPLKVQALEGKLKGIFPKLDARADLHWTGSFGASDTGTPSIGRVPGKRRLFAVLGFGGNGITFSMLAAQILRGLITGAGDSDEKLFALGRLSGKSGNGLGGTRATRTPGSS
jgi:glycine/D-amino acid oxidase-like deaminating enzyme